MVFCRESRDEGARGLSSAARSASSRRDRASSTRCSARRISRFSTRGFEEGSVVMGSERGSKGSSGEWWWWGPSWRDSIRTPSAMVWMMLARDERRFLRETSSPSKSEISLDVLWKIFFLDMKVVLKSPSSSPQGKCKGAELPVKRSCPGKGEKLVIIEDLLAHNATMTGDVRLRIEIGGFEDFELLTQR
ncbi:adenine phosphoribosyltransferase [Striga asiatica]|uniref:Adenine phosphoribosyltransferase n=1 Tax=Striga asiatica TaxID=4170 RepID=A0A5A7PUW2_STRAF|nr:adenine phosphoribosyltransferase [Striga asiatica]